jgi:hypothetical protein
MRFGIGPVMTGSAEVDLTYSEADEQFRAEFRTWLDATHRERIARLVVDGA